MKKAFTLAEVLITLAIIGIAAALTIPSLVTKYQEKQTVARVQKFYSTMNQSFKMAVMEYGELENWGLVQSGPNADGNYEEGADESKDRMVDILTKNMKVVSRCRRTEGNCKKYLVVNLNGLSHIYAVENAVFADGSQVNAVWIYSSDYRAARGEVIYDVNGKHGPNRLGHDIFYFYLTDNGIVPMGLENSNLNFDKTCKSTYNKANAGYGCAAWVVHKGNMDYLHCDDLSWSGKTKCK